MDELATWKQDPRDIADHAEGAFAPVSWPLPVIAGKPVSRGSRPEFTTSDESGGDVAGDTSTTGTVGDGDTLTGTIGTETDEDWYAVDLLAGQTIELLQADTNTEPTIFFQNPDGSSNWEYSTLFIFETQQVGASLTATTDGRYFVNVSPGGAAGVNYSISARIFTDDAGNDDTSSNTISVGETFAGNIDFDGDEDWFGIDLLPDEGVLVELIATGGQSGGVNLTMVDPGTVADGAQVVNPSSAQLAFGAAEAGRHFIAANLAEGGYTLSVTPIADDYGITPETRGTLLRDTFTVGEFNFRGDQDEFSFTGTAGETIVFATILASDNAFTFPGPTLTAPNGSVVTPGFISDPVQTAPYLDRLPTEILIYTLPESGTFRFNVQGGINAQVEPIEYGLLAFDIPERVVPAALDFIFPDGTIAWSPLPSTIGATPTATPTDVTINLREYIDDMGLTVDDTFYAVAEGEEIFNAAGNQLFFTETGATIENRGTIWVQDGTAGTTSQAIGGSDLNLVTNFGTIAALNAQGTATGIRSNNNGLLKNHGDLIVVADGGPAIGYQVTNPANFNIANGVSDDYTVENTGTISVWAGDRFNSNTSFATGLALQTDQNISGDSAPNVLNSGTIEAVGITRAAGLFLPEGGIVHNSGTIYANSLIEEFAVGISALGALSLNVQNSGVIDAVYAIAMIDATGGNIPNDDDLGRAPAVVNNTGSIFGHIVLVGSVDTITNDGLIDGFIELRDGSDTYTGTSKSSLTQLVDLGAGDDQATGGLGAETFIGGTGNDLLSGNAGNDLLIGDDGSPAQVEALLASLGL